ncbi:MAG: 23S rRNA (guanosine(2251)-2'-O)-methyltransferase RlmB [Rickettsiaceae bacterium]
MNLKHKVSNHVKAQYYIFGTHAVIAAANNPRRKVINIFCLSKQLHTLKSFIKNYELIVVDANFIINNIGQDKIHQGVIALVDTVFKNGINELDFTPSRDRVAILDQIVDPQNVGAIIRSAAAFGFNKIIVAKDNAPDENSTIAKAACGCLELVQITKVVNINKTILDLKNRGFWIVGLDTNGQENLEPVKDIEKIAVIIGSEHKGMRQLTRQSCDFLIKIPISHQVESLNASNAASIIFHSLHNLN